MFEKCLILMCGCPGSGKTTFAQSIMNDVTQYPVHYVSRDSIRFSLLKDCDAYFSKEDLVFEKWIAAIQEFLDSPEDCYIIADATHLTERSRTKTLDALKLPENIKIIPIVMTTPLEECKRRNEKRDGRALVPTRSVEQMFNKFHYPTRDEKYPYWEILKV